MLITVNGEKGEHQNGLSISSMLESLGIKEAHVAVELNKDIVPRTQFSEKQLKENDCLEIVTFVGGG